MNKSISKNKTIDHNNIRKAIIFSVLAALSLSIMAFFVKLAAPYSSSSVVIFFRFSMSFLYVLIALFIKKISGNAISVKTKIIKLHFARAVCALLSVASLFYALRFIPLIDGNLLFMTVPLLIPIEGYFLFHKKTKLFHWIAVIIGFIGIVFVLKPTSHAFNPKAIFGFMSGAFSAISFIFMRKISKQDSNWVSMFYYFMFAFIVSGIISIFDWELIDKGIYLLIGVGFFGTMFQDLLIRASLYASAKITSSFLYLSIIFSSGFDLIFWNYFPSDLSLLGIALVIASSLIIILKAKR
jgi:drug/metabolite transporter (DMT)-like permease